MKSRRSLSNCDPRGLGFAVFICISLTLQVSESWGQVSIPDRFGGDNISHRVNHFGKCNSCRKSKPMSSRVGAREVQYGGNAGLPNFGIITHGPWYNGPTFSLLSKQRCFRGTVRQQIPTAACSVIMEPFSVGAGPQLHRQNPNEPDPTYEPRYPLD